jgi:putative phosphoribosyl transferase
VGILVEKKVLRNRTHALSTRAGAGRLLAPYLAQYKSSETIVLAIPAGGVPVGAEIALALSVPLDLLVVRKIQIPWNTEAGFGAVCPDGTQVLNEPLMRSLALEDADLETQIRKAKEVISTREKLFRAGRLFPAVENKTVILTDDGLASGYTMLAAIKCVKKKSPRKIIAAVPTAFERTAYFVLKELDELYCLNMRSGPTFAVADAYREWYDLPDREVMDILRKLAERGLYTF